jgi:hypothetical protein
LIRLRIGLAIARRLPGDFFKDCRQEGHLFAIRAMVWNVAPQA